MRHRRSTKQQQPSTYLTGLALSSLALACLFLHIPAAHADWLIMSENGKLVETQGPWAVDGSALTYTDTQGEKHQVALGKVNLEASEKLTAMKAAKPFVPQLDSETPEAPAAKAVKASKAPKAAPRSQAAKSQAADKAKATGEPKITLYRTSWCGYCNRTSRLLESLDVAYVEKDIEADPEAAAEYRRKGNGYTGIPLTDINGQMVKGFKATLIHSLVMKLKQEEAAAAGASESETDR